MLPEDPKNYFALLDSLKQKIRQAQLRAAISVNVQMLNTYWEIGIVVAEQEQAAGWGKKIVENLAQDLKAEFPSMKGFSARNLRYMRDFALAYPQFPILQVTLAKLETNNQEPEKSTDLSNTSILQAPLAKLSWYHHITLLDKVKDEQERKFYIIETANNGWSRNVLVHQIESKLYERQGRISSNFDRTIDNQESELVQQLFKDPYKFDFLSLSTQAKERDLEDALCNQLTKFLLELGQHFAYMGRQYKMTLGDNEYFYDLLFYHTRLKRYIVVELKIDEFKPEYKGKMDFYLNLADDQLKSTGDEASIGLILCKTKNGLVAEYALKNGNNPIGIAEYTLNINLPDDIRAEMPSIEELETKMSIGTQNAMKYDSQENENTASNLSKLNSI